MDKDPDFVKGYQGVRVVILGASGFIGRWVAKALTDAGADLYLFVRKKDSAADVFSCYGVRGVIQKVDLSDLGSLEDLLRNIRPSVIFNLAGYGVNPTEQEEQRAYQINADLPVAICQVLAFIRDPEWDGQDLIHVGSVAEYGPIGGDLSEDSTASPTTLYGKSKLAGTQRLAQCCRSLGVKGLTARLFTVYGPGEPPWRLLPSLTAAAKIGEEVLLSTGDQKRDFTYVEDVAEGLLRLGLCRATPGEIINLATGTLKSVHEFIDVSGAMLGIPAERLKFGESPPRPWELDHDPVTLERLQDRVHWVPQTQLAEGIHKTLVSEFA